MAVLRCNSWHSIEVAGRAKAQSVDAPDSTATKLRCLPYPGPIGVSRSSIMRCAA